MLRAEDSFDNPVEAKSLRDTLKRQRDEQEAHLKQQLADLAKQRAVDDLHIVILEFLQAASDDGSLTVDIDAHLAISYDQKTNKWSMAQNISMPRVKTVAAATAQTRKSAPAVESRTNTPVNRRAWKPFGQRPPQEEEYFIPILQALRHFGWSATPEQITPLVLEKMRPKLSENDFERIPSGMFIRWECRMRFARKRMKDQDPPLLNPNSPRGLWEGTDAGRRYLEEME